MPTLRLDSPANALNMTAGASLPRRMKVGTRPAFSAGGRGDHLVPYPHTLGRRFHFVSLGAFIIVLTLGAAAIALWAATRFPRLGPETLTAALLQVGIALAAGFLLVPAGMRSVLTFAPPTGPLLATFLFALPGLTYLFLASLWAMRVLQRILSRGRFR